MNLLFSMDFAAQYPCAGRPQICDRVRKRRVAVKVYPLFFCGLLFTSLFAVSATPAGALLISRDDVPSAVTSAFEGAHPKATVKGYRQTERDGATVY